MAALCSHSSCLKVWDSALSSNARTYKDECSQFFSGTLPLVSKKVVLSSAGPGKFSQLAVTAQAGVEPSISVKESVQKQDNPLQATEHGVQGQGQGILFGMRIPKDFFVAQGFGETDEGGGTDPWETGSYDLALEDAGIMNLNIVPYTSVVPPEAKEISYEEAQKFFHHGAVLETIIAEMNGVKGDRISAGVGRAQVRSKETGHVIGGYAAEYKGHAKKSDVERILGEDLRGIFDRRFKMDEYEMFDEKYCIQESEVCKGFGTVIACLCFVTYIIPMYPPTTKMT